MLDSEVGWFMHRTLNMDLCLEHARQVLNPCTGIDPHGLRFHRSRSTRAMFERLEPTRQMYRTWRGALLVADPVATLRLPDALLTAYRKSDVVRCATRIPVPWSRVSCINDGEHCVDVGGVTLVSQRFGSIRAWVPFDSYVDTSLSLVSCTKRKGLRLAGEQRLPSPHSTPFCCFGMWALVNCDPHNANAFGTVATAVLNAPHQAQEGDLAVDCSDDHPTLVDADDPGDERKRPTDGLTHAYVTIQQTNMSATDYLAAKVPRPLQEACKQEWDDAPREILELIHEYAADAHHLLKLCCETHNLQVVEDVAAWTVADEEDDEVTEYVDEE
jgi:hypothetical protein